MKSQDTDKILIKHRRGVPFVMIPNDLLADANLSWQAKGVLCYLLSKPQDWMVRIKDIVANGADGKAAVRSAMEELVELGYAKLDQERRASGEFERWFYRVADFPLFLGTEQPLSENRTMKDAQLSDSPLSVLPFPENRTLTNTEVTNTEVYKETPLTPQGGTAGLEKASASLPPEAVLWNKHCGELPKVLNMPQDRQRKIAARRRDEFWTENFEAAVLKAANNPFCKGENDRGWRANFDFFLKPGTVAQIMEGKFDNTPGKAPANGQGAPRPASIHEMRAVIAAKEKECARIKYKYCNDSGAFDTWSDQTQQKIFLRLQKEIREINARLASVPV